MRKLTRREAERRLMRAPKSEKRDAAFCKDLKDKKCPVELCEIKSRNHMSIIMRFSKDEDPALAAALQFIDKCCGK